MPPPLSETARAKVQYWFDCGKDNDFVFDRTDISRRQITRMRRYWRKYGEVTKPGGAHGRPLLLQEEHQSTLLLYLEDRPTAYLDEMAWFLFDEYDIICSEMTVWRNLHRLGWSRKKGTKVAKERNERLRDDWALRLGDWDANQLIYIDESASNERTGDRKYAWGPVGLPSYSIQCLKRSKRWSILPAFSVDGYLTWMIHHGSITAQLFCDFIRYQVLPLCSTDGIGPRSVLIMDNASCHRNEELEIMCRDANVTLAFLPPYSPDYNPIETSFAILKAWIRRNIELAEAYTPEIGGFGRFLEEAVKTVQETSFNHTDEKGDPGNLFRLAGVSYP